MQLTSEQWFYILVVTVALFGLIAVLGGIFNWRWVLYSSGLRFFMMFGERTGRAVAVIVGIILIGGVVYAMLAAAGVISSPLRLQFATATPRP
jgi:hypothetical protein